MHQATKTDFLLHEFIKVVHRNDLLVSVLTTSLSQEPHRWLEMKVYLQKIGDQSLRRQSGNKKYVSHHPLHCN